MKCKIKGVRERNNFSCLSGQFLCTFLCCTVFFIAIGAGSCNPTRQYQYLMVFDFNFFNVAGCMLWTKWKASEFSGDCDNTFPFCCTWGRVLLLVLECQNAQFSWSPTTESLMYRFDLMNNFLHILDTFTNFLMNRLTTDRP